MSDFIDLICIIAFVAGTALFGFWLAKDMYEKDAVERGYAEICVDKSWAWKGECGE